MKWSSMNVPQSIKESVSEDEETPAVDLHDFENAFEETDKKQNKEEKQVIAKLWKTSAAEQYLKQRRELTLDGFIAGRIGRCNSEADFLETLDFESLIDNAPKQSVAKVHNIEIPPITDIQEADNQSPLKARLQYTPSEFSIVNNYEGEVTIYNEILAASHVQIVTNK